MSKKISLTKTTASRIYFQYIPVNSGSSNSPKLTSIQRMSPMLGKSISEKLVNSPFIQTYPRWLSGGIKARKNYLSVSSRFRDGSVQLSFKIKNYELIYTYIFEAIPF